MLRRALAMAAEEATAALAPPAGFTVAPPAGTTMPPPAGICAAVGPPRAGSSGGRVAGARCGAGARYESAAEGIRTGVTDAAATADARSRVLATAGFLDEQLAGLGRGTPVLGARLSELLRCLLRQQLRLIFEPDHRNDALLASIPRGRRIGYLCPEANSAAKVVALALYDYSAHKSLATHPAMMTLLTAHRRGSSSRLVAGEREALLSFAEAHDALSHLLAHPAVTCMPPKDWAPLRALLTRAKAARCDDEALYFPLADVPRFLEELRQSAHVAAAIRAAVGCER
mmetsp:Transcript_471/g.1363  ORF Transcript_471/g.1363 Transcript_471/m.1363 type:complete len:286 (+) Transcript_471:3745-4602(+)